MSRYKSRYGIVDAFRWTGGPDQAEDPKWAVDAIFKERIIRFENPGTSLVALLVDTPDGEEVAVQGDWIVRTAAGELYVVTHAVFQPSYKWVG